MKGGLTVTAGKGGLTGAGWINWGGVGWINCGGGEGWIN